MSSLEKDSQPSWKEQQAMESRPLEVWVFGDYRDYSRNRVTLELIAKGRQLAGKLSGRCAVVVLGWGTAQYVMEYIAHGAQMVYVMEAPHLAEFQPASYTRAVCEMVRRYGPWILLVGGTDFGREFAPRVAKRLQTGLSSYCVELDIDPQSGLLVQSTPAFGGRLVAQVVTPLKRPQMATVRPGVFRELPHEEGAWAPVLYVEAVRAEDAERVEVLSCEPIREEGSELEEAEVVVSGGLGVGGPEQFRMLQRLASLLGAQLGATRPVVSRGLVAEERMIGQTGRTVRPRVLLTVGTSGALQYTASIANSHYIIAVDKNPEAPIFRHSDLGVVGDSREILPRLVSALERLYMTGEEVAHG